MRLKMNPENKEKKEKTQEHKEHFVISVYGEEEQHNEIPYPCILDALYGIFDITFDNGMFKFSGGDDGYYGRKLTPEQFRIFISELQNLLEKEVNK